MGGQDSKIYRLSEYFFVPLLLYQAAHNVETVGRSCRVFSQDEPSSRYDMCTNVYIVEFA